MRFLFSGLLSLGVVAIARKLTLPINPAFGGVFVLRTALAIVAVVISILVCWLLLGRRVFLISDREIVSCWQIWPFVQFKIERLARARIRNVWVESVKRRSRGWTSTTYTLWAEYNGMRQELYAPLTKFEGERLLQGPFAGVATDTGGTHE